MNIRAILLPLAALVVVGVLIYLRPDRTAEAPQGDAPLPVAVDQEFRFVHKVEFQVPPGQVLNRGPLEDRVERWFDRLLWASSRIVFRTQEQIATLDEAGQLRYVEMMRREWQQDPRRMAKHLTCLGTFQIPEAEELILEATQQTDNLVRGEAARALTLLDSPLAAARAAELLYDPTEMVRRSAVRALTTMEAQEALAALEEYAAKGEGDGIRHVLHRLGRNTEDPTAILVLRKHLAPDDPARIMALEGLARFGDLVAMEEVHSMLESPDIVVQSQGLKIMTLVPPELVEIEWLERFLSNRWPEMRHLLGSILCNLACQPEPNQAELLEEYLNRQVGDGDMQVRQQALGGLYRLGRTDLAEIYLKAIGTASLLSLHTAVDVSTRIMGDKRAGPLIVKRLETEQNPTNIAILAVGLGNVQEPTGLEPLLRILRQARPDEPRDGSGTPLSKIAAQRLALLGLPIVEKLLAVLDEDVHEEAKLRAIDTLRGMGSEADCLDELIEVSLDKERSKAVRMAALESLPLLKSDGLFNALLDVLEEYDDYDLGRRAMTILYDYS
ncbi:MAG: HEAT repeat domain-containing protein [Planctomycetota bacterium]